jgi:glycosyltransferase involved in cell wall biosynthesis
MASAGLAGRLSPRQGQFLTVSTVRIALVYRNVNYSGSIERCVAFLAGELARAGADVHCYCNPGSSTDGIPGVQFHPVRPVTVSRRRLGYAAECASFAVAATRDIRAARHTFDIVDVVGPAGWEQDVVTVHGVTHAHQRRWPAEGGQDRALAGVRAFAAPVAAPIFAVRRGIERLQFRPGRFSRVIAVTERVAADVMRVHGVPSERIDVIPPPIDVVRFASRNGSNVRRELGLAHDTRLLLFVGHNFERKGLDDALRSLTGLDETVHLVVVGGSDPTGHLRQAAELGVGGRVHFVGRTDGAERYFHDADVLVLPTKNDPWGNVLIEAMAAGLPVVTSAVAGAAKVVRSHGAGVVIDDLSPTVLRTEIRALLAAPERMAEQAAAGRHAALEYSVEKNAQATLTTYEQVLRERRGNRRAPRKVTPKATPAKRIATLPRMGGMNPYQRLLHDHLRPLGFEYVSGARLRVSWLWAARPDVDLVHIHWPQALYTYTGGPKVLRPALSWLKLAAFVLCLRLARRLGYRLAWTVHQVYPHDRTPSLRDRVAARSLARAADVLIAHDETTAASSCRELGIPASRMTVIPHASWVGIYPPGRPRHEVRGALGIPDSAFTFLVFGELRAHKEVSRVLEAFRAAPGDDLALVVAGMPKDAETIAALRRCAAEDPRVRLKLEFVYAESVAELFGACDAVIAPRTDGGTSGSLLLGPSLGLPTIACNCPAYAEVLAGGASGWLFEPDVQSLREAIEEAAADPAAASAKGAAALATMSQRSWDDVARRTAALLEPSVQA